MSTVHEVIKYLENLEGRLAAVEKAKKVVSLRQEFDLTMPVGGREVKFPTGVFSKSPVVVASAQVETYPGQGESLSGIISVTVGRVTENGFRYVAKAMAEPPGNAKLYLCWIASEEFEK